MNMRKRVKKNRESWNMMRGLQRITAKCVFCVATIAGTIGSTAIADEPVIGTDYSGERHGNGSVRRYDLSTQRSRRRRV